MRTGVFVQVRLGSTRLPGKALLPLAGATVIQHVMRALIGVPADVHALLTDEASEAVLRPFAHREGFELLRGPDEDVLERYCLACRAYDVQRVVRATGDNPLTCPRMAVAIMEVHARTGADLSHYLRLPWGSGVEVVESAALFRAEREAQRQDERENLTTYLYRHPETFTIQEPIAPESADCVDARVTVDTPDDYEAVKSIFQELYIGFPIEAERIVAWYRLRGMGECSPEAGRGSVYA